MHRWYKLLLLLEAGGAIHANFQLRPKGVWPDHESPDVHYTSLCGMHSVRHILWQTWTHNL